MTLADLHAFISDDLKYEKENMTSFFTSDREWNRLSEYTYLDLGLDEDEGVEGTSVPGAMSDMTLADVIGPSIWNWSTPGGMKKAARNCCWPTVRLPISSIRQHLR